MMERITISGTAEVEGRPVSVGFAAVEDAAKNHQMLISTILSLNFAAAALRGEWGDASRIAMAKEVGWHNES